MRNGLSVVMLTMISACPWPAAAQSPGAPAGNSTAPPSPAPIVHPEAPALSPQQIQQALSHYSHEPAPGEVVRWMLSNYESLAAVDSALNRARTSGLLPEVRARTRRGFGQGASETTLDEEGRLQLSTDDDFWLEGSLRFDLTRLLFATEETALLRERRARVLERDARVERCLALYFERRRLQVERHLTSVPTGFGPTEARQGAVRREIRIAQLTAVLDALTRGRFSGRGQ